tara:strand:+ start:6976 stop:8349 length:1374 start_codon:yes stop_codon:yes gene_type:complete
MGSIAPDVLQQFDDSDGNPLAGGKVYTYEAGTTTLQASYTDSGLGTPNANPVILDAAGRANIWLDDSLSYKIAVYDANDALIKTVDNLVGLVNADSVVTASIQDDAVTQAKIADDAVGADQLQDDASVDANRAVTTNHIRNQAITGEKLASSVADDSTLELSGSSLRIKDDGITQAKLADPYRTLGFLIGLSAFDGSFDNSAETSQTRGLAFNSDGTKMYILGPDVGNSGDDSAVWQYSLATAYDVVTASYDSVKLDVSSQLGANGSRDMAFSSDGTKMFLSSFFNDEVHQYSLSSGFDLSTASYDSVSFDPTSQDTALGGFTFNSDGTKLYVVGQTNDTIYQYSMASAWDLSSVTYDSLSKDISSQSTNPLIARFNSDGTKLFLLSGDTTEQIYQYALSTAYNISTASYTGVAFNPSAVEASSMGLAFSSDGTKMFIGGGTSGEVHQYVTGFLTPA